MEKDITRTHWDVGDRGLTRTSRGRSTHFRANANEGADRHGRWLPHHGNTGRLEPVEPRRHMGTFGEHVVMDQRRTSECPRHSGRARECEMAPCQFAITSRSPAAGDQYGPALLQRGGSAKATTVSPCVVPIPAWPPAEMTTNCRPLFSDT